MTGRRWDGGGEHFVGRRSPPGAVAADSVHWHAQGAVAAIPIYNVRRRALVRANDGNVRRRALCVPMYAAATCVTSFNF